MTFQHRPVLLKAAVDYLNIQEDGTYVDATLGGGGHAENILSALSLKGRLVGIDQDPESVIFVREKFQTDSRITIVNSNFQNLKEILYDLGIHKVDGILLDLGVSSHQLDTLERGFSFRGSAPLDMRMSQSGKSAADIINKYSQEKLAEIFKEYGEERFSGPISQLIVAQRIKQPFSSTDQLSRLVEEFYANKPRSRKIHPATKIFQALRIEVNQELEVLKKVLSDAEELLNINGRLVIITFHSLEDSIVKGFFKENSVPRIKFNKYGTNEIKSDKPLILINKKPITPSELEIEENPRSRSAKMRVAEKI